MLSLIYFLLFCFVLFCFVLFYSIVLIATASITAISSHDELEQITGPEDVEILNRSRENSDAIATATSATSAIATIGSSPAAATASPVAGVGNQRRLSDRKTSIGSNTSTVETPQQSRRNSRAGSDPPVTATDAADKTYLLPSATAPKVALPSLSSSALNALLSSSSSSSSAASLLSNATPVADADVPPLSDFINEAYCDPIPDDNFWELSDEPHTQTQGNGTVILFCDIADS